MDIHDIFTVYCEISRFCNSFFIYGCVWCGLALVAGYVVMDWRGCLIGLVNDIGI